MIMLLPAFYVGSHVAVNYYNNNFHEIITGELYRSAQPDYQLITYLWKNYKIKSIINLRGESKEQPWYQEEEQITKKLGIHLMNFRMSAFRELTTKEINTLIEMMKNSPKPLLIHCKGGADRTGLASALYLMTIVSDSASQAENQLSFIYGYLPLLYPKKQAMQSTFTKVKKLYTRSEQQKISSIITEQSSRNTIKNKELF